MKKWNARAWIAALLLALLPCAACAGTVETVYYTNNFDRYYHADPDCDCPPVETPWWSGEARTFYEREIYRKYEISEEAALAFDRSACPVCAAGYAPVYLGACAPEWDWEEAPWGIGMDPKRKATAVAALPQAYRDETAATSEKFEAYFAEVYDPEDGEFKRRHAYPARFAEVYANNSGGHTYLIVEPDGAILDAFERLFGGGAWILPAKYGYDEVYAQREAVYDALTAWCDAHPELDAKAASGSSSSALENGATIGIYGADWRQAAAAMEEIAPIYVHFMHVEHMDVTVSAGD